DGAENSTVRLGVVADLRVLQDRHRLPQANRLKGTSDACAGNCPRRQVVESSRAKRDTAAVGPIHAGQTIDQRRFPGAIGTDDRVNRRLTRLEADLVYRDKA